MNASARKVSVQFLSWLSDEEMMEQWKKHIHSSQYV